MYPVPYRLSRTYSASSIASDSSIDDDTSTTFSNADPVDGGIKRTRKRFTGVQLMLLEELYHSCSHPTREQRETVATNAGLELRSVTVWFQNRRQSERKIALMNGQLPRSSMNVVSGKPRMQRKSSAKKQARLLRNSPSASSVMSVISTRSIYDVQCPRLTDYGRPSLDSIASRFERQLSGQPRRSTHTRTHSFPDLSNSSHTTLPPQTPPRARALWESMPSSPDSPEDRARDDLTFFYHPSAKLTLEWACAAARRMPMKEDLDDVDEHLDVRMSAGNSSNENSQLARAFFRSGGREAEEEPIEDMVMDVGGDTDVETEAHEAITPCSSQVMEPALKNFQTVGGLDVDADAMDVCERDDRHDEETVKAALTLCGLSERFWN